MCLWHRSLLAAGNLLLVGLFLPVAAVSADTSQLKSTVDDLKTTAKVKGEVAPIRWQTSASGRNFDVQLAGINYRGRIEKTLVEQKRLRRDRATVWLALRNVTLSITQTSITGRRQSATCGRIDIRLAEQRELWMAIDVRKSGGQGGQELSIESTRFKLGPGTWSVGSPAWVRVSGLGMTESRVTSSIRGGLQESADTIETKLKDEAPALLANVSDQVAAFLGDDKLAAR